MCKLEESRFQCVYGSKPFPMGIVHDLILTISTSQQQQQLFEILIIKTPS